MKWVFSDIFVVYFGMRCNRVYLQCVTDLLYKPTLALSRLCCRILSRKLYEFELMQKVGIGSRLRSFALHLTAAGLSVCQFEL